MRAPLKTLLHLNCKAIAAILKRRACIIFFNFLIFRLQPPGLSAILSIGMLSFFQHCHHSFKGFAAVAGIISILVLQLAFTVFLKTSALSAESDVLVRNAKVALYPVGLPIENTIASVPTDEVISTGSGGDSEVSLKHTQFRTETASYQKKPVVRHDRTAKFAKKASNPTPKVVFSDTIIEVVYTSANTRPRGEAREAAKFEDVQAITPKPAVMKTKPDKRSFVASVLPIVKKPYGWIKAIGSKIF